MINSETISRKVYVYDIWRIVWNYCNY